MARAVPEWIGKTPDTKIPERVRVRIFEKYEGRCYLTGVKIAGKTWEAEHILALSLGGENRESNLAPVLAKAHKVKTRDDMAKKKKNERVRKKHILTGAKRSTLPGSKGSKWKRKVDGTVVRRDDD